MQKKASIWSTLAIIAVTIIAGVILVACSSSSSALTCNHTAQDNSNITIVSDTEVATAKALQSTVSVKTTFTRQTGSQVSTATSAGSGVIYKIEGNNVWIITNYHVIYDYSLQNYNRAYEVLFYEHEDTPVTATLIDGGATAMDKDIAFLKVSVDLDCITSADTINDVRMGERTIVIGNALGDGIAVTSGVVSKVLETISMEALDNATNLRPNQKRYVDVQVMRTDAAINSGNSGGGLFNIRGELMGIVNAKVVSDGVEGMGYAIPISIAVGEAVRLNIA